jgi:hypothetical protein
MMVTGIGASDAAREDGEGGPTSRLFRDLQFTIGARCIDFIRFLTLGAFIQVIDMSLQKQTT